MAARECGTGKAATGFIQPTGSLSRPHQYGITTEEFEAKLKAQKGMCAICKIKRARVIDHCHAVFKVRGILCHSCNFALGCAKDSPAILRRAVKYLKESCGA